MVLKPIWRIEISSVKIFPSYCLFRYASCSARPIELVLPLSMDLLRGFQQRWFKVQYNNLTSLM